MTKRVKSTLIKKNIPNIELTLIFFNEKKNEFELKIVFSYYNIIKYIILK